MAIQFSKKFKIISLHLALIITTFCFLLFILFQVILPKLTRYQEEISVPNLKGMTPDLFKPYLEKQRLRYQINQDELYLSQYPPEAVIDQHPTAGEHVKRGRTIYLTLNSTQVPTVTMPNLIDRSIRNAYLHLKEKKLICDSIHYIPDVAQGAVLEQYYENKPVVAGEKVPQGAAIHLIVGAGLGNPSANVPNVINKTIEAATLLLLDAGLGLPTITYKNVTITTEETDRSQLSNNPNIVVQQEPNAGSKITLGTPVQLWLSKKEE